MNNTNVLIESIEIKDVIDIALLQTFQDNFAESMDIASVTVDRNGNPVTKPSCYTRFCTNFIHSTTIGDSRCAESHKKGGEMAAITGKPYIYTCHAGLIDFAAPIMIDGNLIGTILGGQVLTEKPDEILYKKVAEEIQVNEEKLIDSVKEVKITTEKNVKAAAEILYIFSNSMSKIGYEELKLKSNSKLLQSEVERTNLLLEESKKLNELMTQRFSILSHELKTPLNIIFSSIQLLESYYNHGTITAENNIFTKYADIMKQNCYRLTRLINNIIDINKIELGFFTLELENKNIVKVIEDITMSVIECASIKKINVIFDTEVEEKIVCCDSEKIERIVLNLLSNAIKYTEVGGNVQVNLYVRDEDLIISVKDDGIGIPEDMIEKIFDTFTQVDSSLRRYAEGSGIGLAIVRSLVKIHGGDIKVISKLGEGSEFIIKLPIYIKEDSISLESYEDLNSKNYEERVKIEFSDVYL
ncbi:PocR ligand-binding domain-containing protein [Clostridium sp. C8-1-8]|uniref:sensor histidine kinase n=1 Tax=Clostridium sp. C8-1-8 TaxID=2698831 RepID=UPI00136F2A24|nr:PocR ligand-binding domain-containing protein [Clostridium sp. C8-1-8]